MCKMYISNLECTCCKSVFPLPRRQDDRREKGHIKDLWCFKCKSETKHLELSHRYLEKETISI